jgi:hypothetical protein
MCGKWKYLVWFYWYFGTVFASDCVAGDKTFMMTTSSASEVSLPAVRAATPDCKDGTALPVLPPPRATRGENQSETSLSLLQDPSPLNPETDMDDITYEDEDSTRSPTPWFMNHGCSITSVAIVVLIAVILFPPVWLRIGV